MGKDVGFVTAFYKNEPVVAAPLSYKSITSGSFEFTDISHACKNVDSELRPSTREEVGAMRINNILSSDIDAAECSYWTSEISSIKAYGIDAACDFNSCMGGIFMLNPRTDTSDVWCVYK